MNTIRLGPAKLIRPSKDVEIFVRSQAEDHLLERFPIGTFKNPVDVNAIIQHQFNFYDSNLRRLVSRISSRDAAQFLLFQYDQASEILHGEKLDVDEARQWSSMEGTFRRSIKFILELMCMNRPVGPPAVPKEYAGSTMEIVFFLAENAVHLAEMSNRVHAMFPEQWYAMIGPKDHDHDFTLRISGPDEQFDHIFSKRVIRDRVSRNEFVPMPQFDIHTATHQGFLDAAFSQSFGMTYGEFIFVISQMIDKAQPAPDGFPVLFIHEEKLLQGLYQSGMSSRGIDLAVRGFSIRAEHLEEENRTVYKPKQSSRAYRRGFFSIPHESGQHLAFSKSMARECMMLLVNSVCYQYLPSEWRSEGTKKALATLSGAAGRWFEKTVERNLGTLGITGGRAKGWIGKGTNRIAIPDEVGELDFLGYDSQNNTIFLVEAKMTYTGLEAAFWRDDIHEFVTSKRSFAVKFRRKIEWVNRNLTEITRALGFQAVRDFKCAMITLYPCVAAQMIKDFKCVSVTELMLDYRERGGWPY